MQKLIQFIAVDCFEVGLRARMHLYWLADEKIIGSRCFSEVLFLLVLHELQVLACFTAL